MSGLAAWWETHSFLSKGLSLSTLNFLWSMDSLEELLSGSLQGMHLSFDRHVISCQSWLVLALCCWVSSPGSHFPITVLSWLLSTVHRYLSPI
jgi:hypothetical protein